MDVGDLGEINVSGYNEMSTSSWLQFLGKACRLQAWPTQENYEAVRDEWASINQKRHRGVTGSQLDGRLSGLVRPELNLVPLL